MYSTVFYLNWNMEIDLAASDSYVIHDMKEDRQVPFLTRWTNTEEVLNSFFF